MSFKTEHTYVRTYVLYVYESTDFVCVAFACTLITLLGIAFYNNDSNIMFLFE